MSHTNPDIDFADRNDALFTDAAGEIYQFLEHDQSGRVWLRREHTWNCGKAWGDRFIVELDVWRALRPYKRKESN